jgi:tRNA(fMet)-specific endonuclease VapC
MSRYCLDTSAYSQFRRADSRVVELIDQAEWIGLPAITLGELWAGFMGGVRREQNEQQLREFVANPVVEVLAVDSEVSRHYADIVADLRRAGRPVPTNDIWIAATASRSGAIVLTYDDHFDSIARIGKLILDAA